jgi:hypothetical protein
MEETINNQILTGEFNLTELEYLMQGIEYYNQSESTTQESTTGSSTSSK